MRAEYLLDPDVVFLNHGSFGACPRAVFEQYQEWQRELEREPVEFIARRLPDLLDIARRALASFVGANPDDVVFVPNATSGVNMAARALTLERGDEVLATSLEYGACDLAWERVCASAGARYVRAQIELPVTSQDEIVEPLLAHVSERTRAIFVSHVASDSALVLPVEEIVRRARERGLVTIVDGAHGPGQLDLDLDALGADFYTGNCHKWLSAPKGAAFLHAHPEWQDRVNGLIVSWGYEDPQTFQSRTERQATRDPSAYLTVPAAIDWFEAHDARDRCHALTHEAHRRLSDVDGVEALAPPSLLAQMVSVRVATDDPDEIQRRLFDEHRIEVPVSARSGEPRLRVSIAPYNEESDLDALLEALPLLLRHAS